MTARPKNLVLAVPAGKSTEAQQHFSRRFAFETDCWDVHATEELEDRGFVLLDVRSRAAFDAGHVPGAIHLPHWQISEKRMAEYSMDTLFVVYCAGPHCNGSTRGALRLAKLGRPVKEMIGGITGWLDEGFELEQS